jgi:hypothetical protein
VSNASLFKHVFSPYLGKYLFQKPERCLFDEDALWLTAAKPLTDAKINTAIVSTAVFGYFLSLCSRSFCIDIDDHTGKGAGYLLSVYQTVAGRLRQYPSLVCKTPRGLHAFYFLAHHVPQVLLIMNVKRVLGGAPVEVRPTESIGLRIPAEPAIIDPRTWLKTNARFKDAVNAAPVYHPVELFGAGILPGEIIETLKERQSKSIGVGTWKSIAKAEAEYGGEGIQSGMTNAVLCEVIPLYRSAGLTPEEAAAEFAALLAPRYEGELRRNPQRLLQRVRAFYKNAPATRFNTLPRQAEAGLFTESIAVALAGMITGAEKTPQQRGALTKKRRTIKKAVTWIERWKLYIESIVGRKEFLEMWNYLYPYFKKNTAEGLTPISRNIFQRIHLNYERWLLPFLKKTGYLERSSYRYSKVYGICYYYRINGYKFIMDNPAPKPKRESKAQARAEAIRSYKREHPKATRKELAKIFGVTERTIQSLHLFAR